LSKAYDLCVGGQEFVSQKLTKSSVRHHFNIYASRCVASDLWRGDGHRQLVACFGIIWRV